MDRFMYILMDKKLLKIYYDDSERKIKRLPIEWIFIRLFFNVIFY